MSAKTSTQPPISRMESVYTEKHPTGEHGKDGFQAKQYRGKDYVNIFLSGNLQCIGNAAAHNPACASGSQAAVMAESSGCSAQIITGRLNMPQTKN